MLFELAKGADAVVTLDGTVLGGVCGAVVNEKTTVDKIECYLTDIPAAQIVSRSYEIILTLETADFAAFADRSFNVLCISCGGVTQRFENGAVKSVKTDIPPAGIISHKVTLEAAQRSVDHE